MFTGSERCTAQLLSVSGAAGAAESVIRGQTRRCDVTCCKVVFGKVATCHASLGVNVRCAHEGLGVDRSPGWWWVGNDGKTQQRRDERSVSGTGSTAVP